MVNYLYVADRNNNRIVKRLASDLSYVSQVGSVGNGNDQFQNPYDVACDGPYLYVADDGNSRIVKRSSVDLSYVGQVAVTTPISVCTDGLYIYVVGGTSHCDVLKYRCSDLGYISKFGIGIATNDPTLGLNAGQGISIDGTYLYVGGSAGAFFHKLNASTMTYVTHVDVGTPSHLGYYWRGNVTNGTHVWILRWQDSILVKCNCSDLSVVWYYGSVGSGDNQFQSPGNNLGYDGIYLYIPDTQNNRIKKHLASDGSYISKIGTSGSGNDNFNFPFAIQLGPLEHPDPPVISAIAGINKNTISWDAVPRADTYNLYWSLIQGTGLAGTKIAGIAELTYLHSPLLSAMTYWYVVTAYDSVNLLESVASNEVSATPRGPSSADGRIIW